MSTIKLLSASGMGVFAAGIGDDAADVAAGNDDDDDVGNCCCCDKGVPAIDFSVGGLCGLLLLPFSWCCCCCGNDNDGCSCWITCSSVSSYL